MTGDMWCICCSFGLTVLIWQNAVLPCGCKMEDIIFLWM